MNRKRRLFLLCFVLLAPLCLFGAWHIYPGLHQRWLDSQLFAAIQRNDSQNVLTLLGQGANPNAQGDASGSEKSFWKWLAAGWSGQRIEKSSIYAIDAAFFSINPQTESPNGQIITILLEHGAALVTSKRYDIRVFQGRFHHGSQGPYVSLDWSEPEQGGGGRDGSITVSHIREQQADALVRAAIKAGAHQ